MEKVAQEFLKLLPFGVIGTMFIAARAIMYENYRSAKAVAVALFVAIPTGLITGGILLELGHKPYTAVGGSVVSVLLAEHVFIYIVNNPAKILEFIKDKFK